MNIEEATLRARPAPWPAGFAAFVGMVETDVALVATYPLAFRRLAASAAVVSLGVAVRLLRRRVVLRVGADGVEVGYLAAWRRVAWRRLGEAVVRPGPSGRTLVLRSAARGRAVADVREARVCGSLDAVLAELRQAGVPVRIGQRRSPRLHHLALVSRWATRLVGVGLAVAVVLILPVPSRYALVPGEVRSAAASLLLPASYPPPPSGEVDLVTTHTGPADLLTIIAARGDPAIEVGSRSAVIGSAPQAVAAEVDRQITATAAAEAVAAAWRWMGVPVTVDGAGIELVTVPLALRAHLRSEDVVETVAGRPTPTLRDFWATVGESRSHPVRLGIRRGRRHFEVVAPANWSIARPGALVAPAEVRVVGAPVSVEIDNSGLTGNSAGLAWALAMLERVGQVDLASGRVVVVTGALSADGVVHSVGGIPQKAVTARRAGATVLVVPAAQLRVARTHAGPTVAVIGVNTLAETVALLGGPPPGLPAFR